MLQATDLLPRVIEDKKRSSWWEKQRNSVEKRIKALRRWSINSGHWAYIRVLRRSESIFGPAILSWLVAPIIAWHLIRRRPNYRQFLRLRAALPDSFWQGHPPFRHFVRMFRNWAGSLATVLFYDRLRSPAWRRRIRVRGTPPHLLPGWPDRPVVLAFFHTGGFPVLRYWLRAEGVPAALRLGAFPPTHRHAQDLRNQGDAAYGMEEIPHGFSSAEGVFRAIRFLRPGRVLLVALEQRDFSKPRNPCPVEDATLCLSEGAFRIAALTGAVLLPVAMRQEGVCRFEIEFGTPVPDAWLKEGKLAESNQFLAAELWRDIRRDPSSMSWSTLEAVDPDRVARRGHWP